MYVILSLSISEKEIKLHPEIVMKIFVCQLLYIIRNHFSRVSRALCKIYKPKIKKKLNGYPAETRTHDPHKIQQHITLKTLHVSPLHHCPSDNFPVQQISFTAIELNSCLPVLPVLEINLRCIVDARNHISLKDQQHNILYFCRYCIFNSDLFCQACTVANEHNIAKES